MKVICAGFPRTGTKSFASALRLLGYNVYDYEESFFFHAKEWIKIYNDGTNVNMFKEMYANIDAVVDAPAFYYWKEILKAFPDAKIVVLERDGDAWVDSYESMLKAYIQRPLWLQLSAYLSQTSMNFRDLVDHNGSIVMGRTPFQHLRPWKKYVSMNKEIHKRKYQDHYHRIKRDAPTDATLWYKISDGWEPLCKFLGKDIPDQPFPNINKGGVVVKRIQNEIIKEQIIKETIISLSVIILFIAFALYVCMNFGWTYICQ